MKPSTKAKGKRALLTMRDRLRRFRAHSQAMNMTSIITRSRRPNIHRQMNPYTMTTRNPTTGQRRIIVTAPQLLLGSNPAFRRLQARGRGMLARRRYNIIRRQPQHLKQFFSKNYKR